MLANVSHDGMAGDHKLLTINILSLRVHIGSQRAPISLNVCLPPRVLDDESTGPDTEQCARLGAGRLRPSGRTTAA